MNAKRITLRSLVHRRVCFGGFRRRVWRYHVLCPWGSIMILRCLLLIVLALLPGGCASDTKAVIKDIDWGSRIGTYTYAEALAELGEPDVISQSSEGTIAEWVLQRSPNIFFGFGFGRGSFGRHTSTGVRAGTTVSPPPSGEYMHLRFDKDGKLAERTKIKY
jgi:hypothetical protein